MHSTFLIIGNGIAGITAAELLRSEDSSCSITVVSDDPYPAYYRPALKDFLAGRVPEAKLWARPATFYQQQRIRFVSGHVSTIDPLRHSVQLHTNQSLHYKKLLLASGSRARSLPCPGLDLAGVSTLRSVADYKEILRQLAGVSSVVVIGTGTLALETAETLNHSGHQVTHLLRYPTLWPQVLDATASDLVLQEERRSGVDLRAEVEISEIVGKKGRVTHVITSTGERIRCDMVLIAIGIEPNCDFIRSCGIPCNRGVLVDAAMRTSAPDVYAAGDVAEVFEPLSGHSLILGQWLPAIQQAKVASYHMLGLLNDGPGFDPTSFYHATSLYGLDFVSIGHTSQMSSRYRELVAEPGPRSYRKILLNAGVPVGALFLGNRHNALAVKRAVDHAVNLMPVLVRLFDDDFYLDDWLDDQHVPEAFLNPHRQEGPRSSGPVQVVQSEAELFGSALGYLVPIPHPKVSLSLSETSLPQEQVHWPIGRDADSSIVLDHSSVSRRHAEIIYRNSDYLLRDRGSANGSFVNNIMLTPNSARALRNNDLLRFGDVRFHFQLRPSVVPSDTQALSPDTILPTPFLDSESVHLHDTASRFLSDTVLASLSPAPTLVIISQQETHQVVALAADERFTLGRDTQNRIALDDQATSRFHAEIFTAPDGFYIRDIGSNNGIFVNKIRITNPFHLSHGDLVVIGNRLLYFSFPASLPSPSLSGSKERPRAAVSEQPTTVQSERSVVGFEHRPMLRPLNEERLRFELDMCIGCDRCMDACPLPTSSLVHIADLNYASSSDTFPDHITRFTHECIMCGSCVPVCPVDNHRDLLMLSLKQRLGSSWEEPVDPTRFTNILPVNWSIAQFMTRLREQSIFSDPQQVPDTYLLHMVASSHLLSLSTDTTLLREGEYGRDLYFILAGRLALFASQGGGQEVQLAIVNRGEYVGEYGMITGQPYTMTTRTLSPSLVMQVPEPVMQRFMELIPNAEQFFTQLNNARSIEGILKRMALFQGVSVSDLHSLIERSAVKYYERDQLLFSENAQTGRPSRETLHILLEGFVKVARLTTTGTGRYKSDERVIAYRQNGDYFAGGLDLLGDGRAVSVTAITRTRVAELPRHALLSLFKRYPEVEQRFSQRMQQYAESGVQAHSMVFESSSLAPSIPPPSSDPAVRAGLHSLVYEGVIEGTEVLTIDLDKCIHCDECEQACERRHGHSRMNRKGMIVGNISIATACRQCQDPVCMLCSRAGIARQPNGEVYITESCIGCGICAERCPYGAISIVNVSEESSREQASWGRFSTFFSREKKRDHKYLPLLNSSTGPRVTSGPLDSAPTENAVEAMRKKVAIKCDLCAGYNDQACIQACPTGAAIRVQPTKFFGSTEEILRRRSI